MHTISLLNLKGGSGKTTMAVNLAGALGGTVLDLDPQESATTWAPQGIDVFRLDVKHAGDLSAKLEELASDGAAYVLVDCPPELDATSLRAAMLSDLAMIPVMPSPLDLWATRSTLDVAKEAQELRERPKRIVLVPSRTVTGTMMAKSLPDVMAKFGEAVAPGISQRIALAECAMGHQWIGDYAPGSPGHQEFLSLATYIRKNRNLDMLIR